MQPTRLMMSIAAKRFRNVRKVFGATIFFFESFLQHDHTAKDCTRTIEKKKEINLVENGAKNFRFFCHFFVQQSYRFDTHTNSHAVYTIMSIRLGLCVSVCVYCVMSKNLQLSNENWLSTTDHETAIVQMMFSTESKCISII